MSRHIARPFSVAAGLLADRLVGEPPASVHPVAGFGWAMQRFEKLIWKDEKPAGVIYAGVGVGLSVVFGRMVRSTTAVVALAVAGRELRRVAGEIGALTVAGDLDAARRLLPALVGRDPSELDESGVAAAVIESLAENTVDAVVAPAMWGLIGGAAGAAAYRAINTMDAMVGHRSPRYQRFGWAAARLDDIANYLPARLFAILVAAVVPARADAIRMAVIGDAPAHPSPNAGVAEAAVAAALGREVGGPLRYGERQENRPRLGRGPRPLPEDIETAIRLVEKTERLLVGALLAGGVVRLLGGRR